MSLWNSNLRGWVGTKDCSFLLQALWNCLMWLIYITNKIQIYKNEMDFMNFFCSNCQLTVVNLNPRNWLQQSWLGAVLTSGNANDSHQAFNPKFNHYILFYLQNIVAQLSPSPCLCKSSGHHVSPRPLHFPPIFPASDISCSLKYSSQSCQNDLCNSSGPV